MATRELLLAVGNNPKPTGKTRGKKTMAKKPRTAKQKAATKKLVAWVKAHKGKRKTKKRNPSTAMVATAAKKNYVTNPRRKMPALDIPIVPALSGATGAVGLDVVMGQLPLPDAMKTGPMRHLFKAGAAIGLGMLADMMMPKQKSFIRDMVTGALTVQAYNAEREMLIQFAPNIALGAFTEFEPMGEYTMLPSNNRSDLSAYTELTAMGQVPEYEGSFTNF